jgi:hypothetical protein
VGGPPDARRHLQLRTLSRLHQDQVIHDLCSEITLAPFDPPEVSEYLSLAFGEVGFTEALADLIYRHSGGNPLFVTALVRDLLTNGTVGGEESKAHPRQKITSVLACGDPCQASQSCHTLQRNVIPSSRH